MEYTKNPCSICLDRECGKKGHCDCSTCKNRLTCPKFLRPTLRITSKCTQKCLHCCFDCSPARTEMMSVEMAEKVALFYKNNEITTTQIMGGECFQNPEWEKILRIVLPTVTRARIVTNGDWAEQCPRFAQVLAEFPQVYVAISNDQWHNGRNIEKAAAICKELNVLHEVCEKTLLTENGIVPIGGGELYYGLYSSFSCYCHNPMNQYAFLITEDGTIFKCPFGAWDYAEVDSYINGGFAARFKEFNLAFYKAFMGSCSYCIRGYEHHMVKERAAKKSAAPA